MNWRALISTNLEGCFHKIQLFVLNTFQKDNLWGRGFNAIEECIVIRSIILGLNSSNKKQKILNIQIFSSVANYIYIYLIFHYYIFYIYIIVQGLPNIPYKHCVIKQQNSFTVCVKIEQRNQNPIQNALLEFLYYMNQNC